MAVDNITLLTCVLLLIFYLGVSSPQFAQETSRAILGCAFGSVMLPF